MNPDPNDVDFIKNLKKLLGIDVKNVEYLLPKLSSEILIDFAAAVTNSDKDEALRLIKIGREMAINDHVTEGRARKDGSSKVEVKHFAALNVGDAVKVDGEDATVKLPIGPGNTVGVMIGGKFEMVNRDEVTKIDEGVLGMSNIPDIRRMQELAGITGPETPNNMPTMSYSQFPEFPEIEIEPIPTNDSVDSDDSDECAEDCGTSAVALLDKLSGMLPNLRLADIKAVRKKLYDIQNQLNESKGSGKLTERLKAIEVRRSKF